MLSLGGRRVVFVGGKGGVGKTTVAAALALRLARDDRVLLVSTDPAHSLGDLFGREVGGEETRLRDGLWGLEVDPEAETDRYLRDVKRTMREFVRPAMYDEIERQMELTRLSPGAVEAATLDRISGILVEDRDRYDRLVFDTAPTGHTLRLLSLPETMSAWMDGLLASRDRSESFRRILEETGRAWGDEPSPADGSEEDDGPVAGDEEEGGDDRAKRIREVLTRRRQKFVRARRVLTDPETSAFLVVVNPEELSVREARRTRETLRELDMSVRAVVVNKVLPRDAEGEFVERRREQEASHLERIDELFSEVVRVRVPLLPGDVRGPDQLGRIGTCLEGADGGAPE